MILFYNILIFWLLDLRLPLLVFSRHLPPTTVQFKLNSSSSRRKLSSLVEKSRNRVCSTMGRSPVFCVRRYDDGNDDNNGDTKQQHIARARHSVSITQEGKSNRKLSLRVFHDVDVQSRQFPNTFLTSCSVGPPRALNYTQSSTVSMSVRRICVTNASTADDTTTLSRRCLA